MATYAADPNLQKKKPGVLDPMPPPGGVGTNPDAFTNAMPAPGVDLGRKTAGPAVADTPPMAQTNVGGGGPLPLGDPHAPTPPTPAAQPPGEDLQTIMARRMAAVQAGQPDPGIGPAAPAVDTPPPMDGGPMLAPPGGPGEGTSNGQPTTPALPTHTGGPIQPPGAPGMDPKAPPGAAPDANTTAYKSALLRMLDDASTPATLADPALKAQSEAAAVGLTRGTEQGRAALAERMAQAGGPGVDSGAFNADLAGLFSGQGEQQAGINAGLVGDANKAKVQQLQSALTMMGNDVNSEEGRALTRELSKAQMDQASHEFEANFGLEGKRLAETIRQFDTSTKAGQDALRQQLEMFKATQAESGRQFDVDAALKKMGIQSQADLGGRDLALRDKLGTGGLNAQIMQMLMQNQQFNTGEAGTNARFSAGQNNNYLQALLSQWGA